MRFKRTVLFALFMILAASVARQAAAQNFDLTTIGPIPEYLKELSEEDFNDKTVQLHENPVGDPHMAYTIRLPQSWKKSDASEAKNMPRGGEQMSISHRVLGRIAKYYTPAMLEASSYIEIKALELDFDISTKNWFLNYSLLNGYALQGLSETAPGRVEALYVLVEGDVSYVVRTVAEINGPRMVVASYYLPDNRWNEERGMQQRVMDSFQFVDPEHVRIEKTRTYSFLEMVKFDYPGSWRLLAPGIDNLETMNASIINSADNVRLDGRIDINLISTELNTTLSQEVQLLKEKLEETGLKVGDMVEKIDDIEVKDHFFFHRIEVYRAENPDKHIRNHEYWLAVLVEDRYYCIITMLTPGRTADFYIWARNIESFKTLVESVRPGMN